MSAYSRSSRSCRASRSQISAGRRALVAALALLPILGACGGATGPVPTLVEMIANMQAAPDSVAHAGLRRFESHYVFGGKQFDQEYTEKVWFDGQGGFAIVPDQILSNPVLPVHVFEQIQLLRAGFLHRYRDFRVIDLVAFASNYAFTSLGQQISYLGRDAYLVEVERKPALGGSSGGRSYLVTIDIATGLVLAYEERAADDSLLSRMAYESIEFAPDLTGIAWHVPDNQEQLLDPALAIAAQVPFPVLVPKALPAGYQFREAATVVDEDQRTWLKATFTDGVENLFFLQAAPAPPALEQGLNDSGQPAEGDHVYVWQAGSVTLMQGKLHGFDLTAVGKVGDQALLEMLDSSLP